jgi:hypothetical protein
MSVTCGPEPGPITGSAAGGNRETARPCDVRIVAAPGLIASATQPVMRYGAGRRGMSRGSSGSVTGKWSFGLFVGDAALRPEDARNALHMVCHPEGLRRFIVNWEEFAGPLIQTIHRPPTRAPRCHPC